MDSPFQCGGVVQKFPAHDRRVNLVLRTDDTAGAVLKIKKGGDPSVGQDYILYPKESITIPGDGYTSVSVVNTGSGNPFVYWTLEPK